MEDPNANDPIREFPRLFVAIALPSEWIRPLEQVAARSKPAADVRFLPAKNLHLTACFVGGVAAEKVPDITRQVAACCARCDPFVLDFEEIRPAPNRRRPRMVWAVFGRHPGFESLVSCLYRDLGPFLAKKEERADPIPHVTLARMKRPLREEVLNLYRPAVPKQLAVDRVRLWESFLSSEGSVYAERAEFRLESSEPA